MKNGEDRNSRGPQVSDSHLKDVLLKQQVDFIGDCIQVPRNITTVYVCSIFIQKVVALIALLRFMHMNNSVVHCHHKTPL